ncbi:MAG: hypothetical protein QOD88_3830 [Mycobacterium sp.]|nr:hypothetical protein [Mycobacterium sp.]
MSARPPHVRALDGLRGLAVLLVIAYHFELTSADGGAHRQILAGGWVGVDIFFVLSGFLITAGLLASAASPHGIRLRSFYTRRVRRLGPAIGVLLAVWLILSLTGAVPVVQLGDHPQDGGAKLALTPVIGFVTLGYNWWLAGQHPSPVGMGHLWSLTIEEQFYLVWPTVMLVAFRFRGLAFVMLRRLCWAGVAVSVALSLFSAYKGHRDWAYFATPTRMLGLLLGALLALSTARAKPVLAAIDRRGWLRIVGAVAAAALLVMSVTMHDDARRLVPLVTVAAALCATLVVRTVILDAGAGARWFGWGWLRWCGRRSYALYLWDAPVVMVCNHVLGFNLLAIMVSTVLTFAFAALSWHFVERRFLARAPQAPAVAAVPASAALPPLAALPAQR